MQNLIDTKIAQMSLDQNWVSESLVYYLKGNIPAYRGRIRPGGDATAKLESAMVDFELNLMTFFLGSSSWRWQALAR